MKAEFRSPAIRRAVDRARRAGYTVQFVPFVSMAGTPEIYPGHIGGYCDYERKHIAVSTNKTFVVRRTRAEIAAILNHECEHAEGSVVATDCPKFGLRCGNKP